MSTTASNFHQLKLENGKLSAEKKDVQVVFSKAKEEVTAMHKENDNLTM
jgi:hypothetical protein